MREMVGLTTPRNALKNDMMMGGVKNGSRLVAGSISGQIAASVQFLTNVIVRMILEDEFYWPRESI